MNETQNQTVREVVFRLAMEWSKPEYGDMAQLYASNRTDELFAALADAGYTIAGPGQEVVPVEVADAAQEALMQAPTRFAGREGERRRICTDWRFARKTDPLPTQEGE